MFFGGYEGTSNSPCAFSPMDSEFEYLSEMFATTPTDGY